MKARITAVVLIIIAVSVCSFVGFGRSDAGDKPPATQEHDFGDKALVLTIKDAKHSEAVGFFSNVKVRRIGDRTFLVGQTPDKTTVWTPLSEILQVTEYDSLKDAIESMAARSRAAKDDK